MEDIIFIYLNSFKPEAVKLELYCGKIFNEKYFKLNPPTFGLNFIEDKEKQNKNFMLFVVLKKFDNFFVRIDILERLFMQIINTNTEQKNEIKVVPEMLNLLGSNKENFVKF